jgi:hypothetical protein
MKTKTYLLGAALVSLLSATAACNSDVDDIPVECDGFLDTTDAATPVSITITNDGADPIYLVGTDCSTTVDLVLRDADGTILSRHGGTCGYTCEDLMTQEIGCAEPAICAQPPTVKIAPGGSYEMAWDGFVTPTVDMPAGCFASSESELGGEAGSCQQLQVAADATYQAAVSVANTIDCGGQACDCTPDENGICMIDFAWAEDVDQAIGEIAYPADTSVTIVLGTEPS